MGLIRRAVVCLSISEMGELTGLKSKADSGLQLFDNQ